MPHFFTFDATNTFCISLDSNPDRWKRMEKRLELSGLTATKWRGVSSAEELTDNFFSSLNMGQKGCSQSHLNIYKHILEHDLDYALILEDDACFDKNWKSKMEEVNIQEIDPEWDAVFLNGSEPIVPRDTWVNTNEQYLTAGYIISKKGVRTLMNQFAGCYASSDWMTTRLQLYGHSYCYFPWLIIQEGKDSNIGSNLEADHAKVIRCLGEIDYGLEENYFL
jgi:glycosyl transferase family 25